MPYTTPTVLEFKTRHQIFQCLSDPIIQEHIDDAERVVDTSWLEDDYQRAIMYLAAHNLVMEGHLGGSPDTAGLITSEKLGDASVNYGNAIDASKNISDYGSTHFGRKYQELLKRNHPGVLTL